MTHNYYEERGRGVVISRVPAPQQQRKPIKYKCILETKRKRMRRCDQRNTCAAAKEANQIRICLRSSRMRAATPSSYDLMHAIAFALALLSFTDAFCSRSTYCNTPTAYVSNQRRSRQSQIILKGKDGNGGDEASGDDDETKEKRRMSDVRTLQNIFYGASASSSTGDTCTANSDDLESPQLDYNTGVFYNLPLWREKLGYTELPGRSLIGFVKDPAYTHLFETLLRSDSETKYFGQLRLDNDDVGINVNAASGASAASSSQESPPRPKETDMNAPLHSWKDRKDNDDTVCVGTLMRINDYIRLDDGRLMLLLHAIERFVVLNPKRILPYCIADVFILPDAEDCETSTSGGNGIGSAMEQSFGLWQDFEYDRTIRFPIDRDENNRDQILPLKEVLFGGGGDAFGSLLPYVPYNFRDNRASAGETGSGDDENSNSEFTLSKVEFNAPISSCPSFSQLMENNVIREVSSFALERAFNSDNISNTDEIERDLWILIDEYVRLRDITNVLPQHLLSLVPTDVDWPEKFTLDKLANIYSAMALKMDAKRAGDINPNNSGSSEMETFGFVADRRDYPSQRRQKRLSYVCTALLGGPVNDHPLLNRTMRRRLLEIPSTKGRLWACRELFEAYNAQFREQQ